jgi:hypothetical protein
MESLLEYLMARTGRESTRGRSLWCESIKPPIAD